MVVQVFIHVPPFSAKPLEVVQVPASNHSVTISWRKPDTARQHRAHVVEWYPEGHKLEELRWVRLGWNDSQAVVTGGTCEAKVETGENTQLHNVLSGAHCCIPSLNRYQAI